MHTRISGGSSETETKELAAMPTGSSSIMAQIAVTPEGKQPKAFRRVRESKIAPVSVEGVAVMPSDLHLESCFHRGRDLDHTSKHHTPIDLRYEGGLDHIIGAAALHHGSRYVDHVAYPDRRREACLDAGYPVGRTEGL